MTITPLAYPNRPLPRGEKHQIFITGTDTDVGKTTISAALCYALLKAGHKPGYYKPALSGARVLNEASVLNQTSDTSTATQFNTRTLIGDDLEHVRETAFLNEPHQVRCSYLFEEAISPHLAARRSHTFINPEILMSDFSQMVADNDYLVVEGAGGAACPLSEDFSIANLIESFKIRAIVVCRAGLGTLHHTISTIAYLRQFDISIAGIVVNGFDSEDFVAQDNLIMLEKMTSLPILAVFPKLEPHYTSEDIRRAVDEHWQPSELIRRIFK